jgi:CubicO group peptidase (beta-lactamase class C family)
MKNLIRLIVVVVVITFPSLAQDSGLPREKIEALEKAITTEMSRQNIPGLSVAIATENQIRWANGYGVSDLENFVPAKANTVYRLGSISKPITAVAVMQLVERGKIDLDAPVQKYVPSFPEKPWPITSRLLLAHMGGIRHYRGEEINITRHYDRLLDGLDIFKNDPLLFEPGTRYSYTTYGYNLLGCVIEGASGMKYVDYVRENIFQPAGMDRMRPDDVFEIILNRAQGYRKTPAGELRNSALADTSYKIPGGGFCSTVVDLGKFAIALQTGKLLKKETLTQMWTRQRMRSGQEVDYGLGWAIDQTAKRVGHGGGQQRITTFLAMIPEKGITVAVMTNLEGASRLVDFAYNLADIATRPTTGR